MVGYKICFCDFFLESVIFSEDIITYGNWTLKKGFFYYFGMSIFVYPGRNFDMYGNQKLDNKKDFSPLCLLQRDLSFSAGKIHV